jgi:hypothetical protein
MDKLYLQEEMERSYLIQRLKKSMNHPFANAFSFGGGLKNGGLSEKAMTLLKNIMSFDYMGSAEFEWGAVPAAFQFLAEQAGNKNVIANKATDKNGKDIYYLCPKEYRVGTENIIFSLLDDEHKLRLKEHCGLKDSLYPRNKWDSETVGWIELDNGFMFFTDLEMYNSVCNLFGITF